MGRGLPKKYAKMGFKKGWREYKKTAGYRRAHGLKGGTKAKKSSPTKKSPKSSSRPSNPAGGAKTSATAKIGVIVRRARTALNLTAPGWGSMFAPGTRTFEDKLYEAIARYSGYDPASGTVDIESAVPAYQGISISLINDWADRKLRNSARISKGKIFPIISELLPMLRARADVVEGATSPMYEAARHYNKRTDGYDPGNHTFALNRVEEYAVGKALVAVYNKVIPQDWKSAANAVLPKGMNPF